MSTAADSAHATALAARAVEAFGSVDLLERTGLTERAAKRQPAGGLAMFGTMPSMVARCDVRRSSTTHPRGALRRCA